jgi:hypothetical protein
MIHQGALSGRGRGEGVDIPMVVEKRIPEVAAGGKRPAHLWV